MCIVCSLMVVTQHLGALIVAAAIRCIEPKLAEVFKFCVICALIKQITQGRSTKLPTLISKYFIVKSLREVLQPLGSKLLKSLRQLPYELIVDVEPVIHAVVAHDRLL